MADSSALIDYSKGPRQWLKVPEVQSDIAAALGSWMQPATFEAQMIIAINDDTLTRCTPESKFKAVNECAALALLPTLGQVALIPRKVYKYSGSGKNRKRTNEVLKEEVSVMPQWQGYKCLMERHPDVEEVTATLIHKSDQYEVISGTNEVIHDYDPFSREFETIADIRGGYVQVKYLDPIRPMKWHLVTAGTIKKAKACAETKKVWDAWLYEQAMKTLYRNAYARRIVPIDPMCGRALQRITEAEDAAVGNDPNRVRIPSQSTVVQTRRPRVMGPVVAKQQGVLPEPKAEAEAEPEGEGDDENPVEPTLAEELLARIACAEYSELSTIDDDINAAINDGALDDMETEAVAQAYIDRKEKLQP